MTTCCAVPVPAFNNAFDRFSVAYSKLTHRLVLMPKRMMAAYAVLILATVGMFAITRPASSRRRTRAIS